MGLAKHLKFIVFFIVLIASPILRASEVTVLCAHVFPAFTKNVVAFQSARRPRTTRAGATSIDLRNETQNWAQDVVRSNERVVTEAQERVANFREARINSDRRASYLRPADDFYTNIGLKFFDIIWSELIEFSVTNAKSQRSLEDFLFIQERYEHAIVMIELIRLNYLPELYDIALIKFNDIHQFYNSPQFNTFIKGFGFSKSELSDDARHFLTINTPQFTSSRLDLLDQIFRTGELDYFIAQSNALRTLDWVNAQVEMLINEGGFTRSPRSDKSDPVINIFVELWILFRTANNLQSILNLQDIGKFSDSDILAMQNFLAQFETFRQSDHFVEITRRTTIQRLKIASLRVLSRNRQARDLIPIVHPDHPLLMREEVLGKLNEQLTFFDGLRHKVDAAMMARDLNSESEGAF